MASATSPTPKAARTRAAILEAAERLFGEQGFDRTRLEDVAAEVGIRRASIVYHFRDKADLYDAVVRDLFETLHGELQEALGSPGSPLARIDAAVSCWIDYVGTRPALARILLREVADAASERRPALLRHSAPITEGVVRFLAEWKARDMPRLSHVDPSHVASVITGSTVFFVAAMPSLLWNTGFDPLSPERLERHKREILEVTWQMLGLEGPTPPVQEQP